MKKIFVQDSLSGKKTPLKTRVDGEVSLYCCGPTVYGLCHVGNARPALTLDLVSRVLEEAGYKVISIANITDVDDKIIKKANEEGRSPDAVAQEFTQAYLKDMQALGVKEVSHRPQATQHIDGIVDMTEKLIGAESAYPADTPYGQDVYFRVDHFKEYGKLSHRDTDDMQAGARVEVGEMKENPLDFALWKAAKEGEPSWKSPWGQGRPGWHIECSAMIRHYYPEGVDIHMGGLDLIFPHHENEIAQSESLQKQSLANYWLHNNMLNLGQEKMSKSLGNDFVTRKFVEKFGAEVLRLFILMHHYRTPIDFNLENIARAENLLKRLYMAKAKINLSEQKEVDFSVLPEDIQKTALNFEEALFDDFNSAKALGFVFKLARYCYREDQHEAWVLLCQMCQRCKKLLGLWGRSSQDALSELEEKKRTRSGFSAEEVAEIDQLLLKRLDYRNQKDFAKSDEIRDQLSARGIEVMDGPDGSSWSLKS